MSAPGASQSTTAATAADVLVDVIARRRPVMTRDLVNDNRSGSTVARAVSWLGAAGLIVTAESDDPRLSGKREKPARGRPLRPYVANPRVICLGVVVVDIGGQPAKLVGMATDISGVACPDVAVPPTILADHQRQTPAALAESIAAYAQIMNSAVPSSHVVIGLGVAIGGNVHRGVLVRSPGATWAPFDLQTAIQNRFPYPVRVDNDATAFAVRNALLGLTAPDETTAVVCLFGDGIGGGLIINRRCWRGKRGIALEPGHLLATPTAQNKTPEVRDCRCGAFGCVEAYAAPNNLARSLASTSTAGTAINLDLAANQPPRPAQEAEFTIAGYALGQGLSSVINTIDPDRIVVYAPPALADPPLNSAAGAWRVALYQAVSVGAFTDHLTPADVIDIQAINAQDLEITCAQAAASLLAEALVEQLTAQELRDPERTPIDIDSCQTVADKRRVHAA